MSSPGQSTPEQGSPSLGSPTSSTPAKTTLAKNNAFGPHAPSWNLAFPDGNLTAVEIVVYCPHWLKCVDVITRFVNNGVKSVYLAAIINEHRDLPGDEGTKMVPNSTTIMMQYAMRRCGFYKWTIGKHHNWNHGTRWNHYSLYVGMFRPPRITHPKQPTPAQAERQESWSCNKVIPPIPFKDLAIHVKKHPSGYDALDLTRCVKYAVAHPDEDWRFPTDFVELLVKKLGGPKPITSSHHDHEAFARCARINFQTPKQSVRGIRGPPRNTNSTPSKSHTTTSAAKRSHSEYEAGQAEESPSNRAARSTMRRTRAPVRKASTSRRSARNINKAVVYDEDKDTFTSHSDGSPAPSKKLKLSLPRASNLEDGDYLFEDTNASEDEMFADDNFDVSDLATPETTTRKLAATRGTRIAAIKAPNFGQLSLTQIPCTTSGTPAKQAIHPELRKLVRRFEELPPTRLQPPALSAGRMQIDDINVHLYGDENSTSKEQLWATAMSSLNGPRRHPPFRVLADLTDPEPWDCSDWAENIRWAKSQKMLYSSTTWTEYDDHLEQIKQHRVTSPWVSEELLQLCTEAGKYKAPKGYVAPTTLPPPFDWTMDGAFVNMHREDLKNQQFVEMNADLLQTDQGASEANDGFAETDDLLQMGVSYSQTGAPEQTIGFQQANNFQYPDNLQQAGRFEQAGGFQNIGYLQEPLSFSQQPSVFYPLNASQLPYEQASAYGQPMTFQQTEGLQHSGSFQQMDDLAMMSGALQMGGDLAENNGQFSGMGGDFWQY